MNSSWADETDVAENTDMGYVVDGVEGAHWADGADRDEGTDVAEMALRMNALLYFDCMGHKELKNIVYNGLWELYSVTAGWDGRRCYQTIKMRSGFLPLGANILPVLVVA